MEEVAAQLLNSGTVVHDNRLVNDAIAPVSASAIEETKLIIRIPAAAANPSVQIERPPRDTIAIGKLRLVLPANLIN